MPLRSDPYEAPEPTVEGFQAHEGASMASFSLAQDLNLHLWWQLLLTDLRTNLTIPG